MTFDWRAAERQRSAEAVRTSAIRDEHGVWRWTTNNAAVPDDCLEAAGVSAADREATRVARERALDAIAEQYRRNWRPPTDREALSEMVNAFGPGATVVDVIAGRKFTLPER